MRNAVNNLQSTYSGFGYVNAVRVSGLSVYLGVCMWGRTVIRNRSIWPD